MKESADRGEAMQIQGKNGSLTALRSCSSAQSIGVTYLRAAGLRAGEKGVEYVRAR